MSKRMSTACAWVNVIGCVFLVCLSRSVATRWSDFADSGILFSFCVAFAALNALMAMVNFRRAYLMGKGGAGE